ncbi:uncharacterized protein LOC62_06G008021 [Vanrija pseudolonga]|uniref:Uncharacterized protein n=1 Tax=Vanrija pseudolonga TaxID=143232 RepID=A0AAF0YDP9_9TREE|nr:hypothetical protein LOC62_06G008021 [Vanrija pseudolonga]
MTVAARLPAPAKLPLTDRKSFRDDFENKKVDLEKEISDIMGTQWTLDVDPLPLSPYVDNSKFKGRIGEVIFGYFEGIPHAMKSQLFYTYPTAKDELNRIVPTHSIGLDVDLDGKYDYCGPTVREGKIVIVFNPAKVWSGAGNGFEKEALLKELTAAEAASDQGGLAPLSVTAKVSINKFYTNDDEPKRNMDDIRKTLNNPAVDFEPNFEAVYSALKTAGRADADDRLAGLTKAYLEDLLFMLKHQKFDKDDMLKEAFADAVPSNKIVFRIVPELQGDGKYGGEYAQPWIEDGILYLQTTPENWGKNTGDVGKKLVDLVSDNA